MKYQIGDLLADEDGKSGIVVIKWDDGDLCALENDAAHPSPIIVGHWPPNKQNEADHELSPLKKAIRKVRGDPPPNSYPHPY